ncbi:hypothetical protein HDE77_003468 [Rhodanobacter sp. MP7CTX1]|nr:hypothetical protein [Rhodanobacter sp. MP7CTX1]
MQPDPVFTLQLNTSFDLPHKIVFAATVNVQLKVGSRIDWPANRPVNRAYRRSRAVKSDREPTSRDALLAPLEVSP